MAKRWGGLAAVLILALVAAGCGNTTLTPSAKVQVVATLFAPYDFAREITGGLADVTMLLPPASESHTFEPTPKDMVAIQNCDLFIYVGGESDTWVGTLLSSADKPGQAIVNLMDCVETVEEAIVEGMQAEEEIDSEPVYDEHVWTSPRNAKLIVQKISDALCGIDEANAPVYRQNTARYLQQLDELDAAFQAVTDEAARHTVIFGDRFPFRYLADAYGLVYFAAFPGCAGESEPSAATVAFLIDKVRAEQLPVIFYTESSDGRMARVISEETGAKALRLHACHNIAKTDFENGVSYLALMTQNVEALKEALQ